jgi:hypothetical protein
MVPQHCGHSRDKGREFRFEFRFLTISHADISNRGWGDYKNKVRPSLTVFYL